MKRYKKTIAAVIGGVVTWGITASADGSYDQTEWWGLAGAVALALGVYTVRNERV